MSKKKPVDDGVGVVVGGERAKRYTSAVSSREVRDLFGHFTPGGPVERERDRKAKEAIRRQEEASQGGTVFSPAR